MASLGSYYTRLPRLPAAQLDHLPGRDGWPIVGNSLQFLADPLAYAQDVLRRFGPVSRANFLFERCVNLISAEANEFVLLDRAGNFSAYQGWEPVLGLLFPRGLMLRDADDHRHHRRLMQPAFRKEALAAYLERMNPRIARHVARWRQAGSLRFYPAVKRLTLEIAADLFLDVQLQAEVDQVNRDFTDLVEASNAIVRVPWIGRKFERGLAGRRRLADLIRARIPSRRESGGSDLLSQLCQAQDEQGRRYDDEEIVDHLIFLMMAAHDTTTSALTTIVYALARHRQWQDRLRDTLAGLDGPRLTHDQLAQLELVEWVLREALRLYPPLTVILRRSLREAHFQEVRIPAGTSVNVFPVATHRLPEWWSDPDRFDPERFAPNRAEHRRHPFAWVPFGGGAHMCLGLHFAEMQVKSVLHALLTGTIIDVADDYAMPFRMAPIVHPRDGLPVRLTPRLRD